MVLLAADLQSSEPGKSTTEGGTIQSLPMSFVMNEKEQEKSEDFGDKTKVKNSKGVNVSTVSYVKYFVSFDSFFPNSEADVQIGAACSAGCMSNAHCRHRGIGEIDGSAEYIMMT